MRDLQLWGKEFIVSYIGTGGQVGFNFIDIGGGSTKDHDDLSEVQFHNIKRLSSYRKGFCQAPSNLAANPPLFLTHNSFRYGHNVWNLEVIGLSIIWFLFYRSLNDEWQGGLRRYLNSECKDGWHAVKNFAWRTHRLKARDNFLIDLSNVRRLSVCLIFQ